ncbi:TetR/AcrR family transcriptional regulator [uncultured Methanolobus sp.]|uniref:TetR/AcrR family transcriptional regulator n=1 Tax=uncultured Methanolobus sp. TaxID=218300 RepID=UPI002AAB4CD5|nr:TetR/AcrR family transcriptional regulator [uncultured Methanolobus sp.]
MSLREKKKNETLNRIFEISSRLFKEKGFESTTVDEITKEAGIAKGTFFNYFPTKESLLFYFKEQREEFIFSIMKEQMLRDIPSKEKIREFLVLVAEYYEKDRELLRLLAFEHRKMIMSSWKKPPHASVRKKKHEHFINMLVEFMREGMDKGSIKSNIDPKLVSETIYAVYFYSLMTWLHSETDYSFSGDISSKIDIIFEGIGV